MHIIHVASGREWRGGERQVWLLARELARQVRLEQRIITRGGSELARRMQSSGIAVAATSWRAGLDPRALFAIRRAASRPDTIVHAHDAHAVTLAGFALLGRSFPLVATRRTTNPLRRPGFWARAARVIAISPAVRETLLRSGLDPQRIVVVPSGTPIAELDAAADSPPQWRARLDIPADAPIAVNVAALTTEKDHLTLLRAAAWLHPSQPRLQWIVAGEGRERRPLEAELRRLDATGYVHLVGSVADVIPLLREATVVVSTSTSEAFGTANLDAMALGRPIVATAVGGVPALLGDSGVLVPPRDPFAVANAVTHLLGDAEISAQLGARARRMAQAYDIAAMAREVLSLYRSLGSHDRKQ